ncbi:hypothetical protein [Streptomyces sp. NBC_01497]|uniref:hypothetical protein n=1 Tax=Streptomyces sp. NBC_01497 TaxID=2903885 RepID=UPI002E37E0F6|nr:hypothetical protein [Streptomyces sp. NBC_01497]
MGLISGYAWILPAVTAAGWILSWWGQRRLRWYLLSAAAVVSVLCVVIGVLTKGPAVSPEDVGCSPAFACMDWDPIYWLEAGLIGLGCCLVLMLLTGAVEIVIRIGRWVSA